MGNKERTKEKNNQTQPSKRTKTIAVQEKEQSSKENEENKDIKDSTEDEHVQIE